MQTHFFFSKEFNRRRDQELVPNMDRLQHIMVNGKGCNKRLEKRVIGALIAARTHNEVTQEKQEFWHALVEFGTRRIIKYSAMTGDERRRRNKSIASVGYEWTVCQPPDPRK